MVSEEPLANISSLWYYYNVDIHSKNTDFYRKNVVIYLGKIVIFAKNDSKVQQNLLNSEHQCLEF